MLSWLNGFSGFSGFVLTVNGLSAPTIARARPRARKGKRRSGGGWWNAGTWAWRMTANGFSFFVLEDKNKVLTSV